MRRHAEPFTAELAAHQQHMEAGATDAAAEQYLTEVAHLCAAYAFRLDVATSGKEHEKTLATHRRLHHVDPWPEETPEVERMKTDPAYLRRCLAAATSEQRIRRTTRRRDLTIPAVFTEHAGDTLRLLSPAMVHEIMERLTTVRHPRTGTVDRTVADVYRVFTDGRTELKEQADTYRFLTRTVQLFTACGAAVESARIGTGYRSSALVLRTRHNAREIRIQAMKAYCETVPVLGSGSFLHDVALGREVEPEAARLLLASAVAGAVAQEIIGSGAAAHPLTRTSLQVHADGKVGFHVLVGQFDRTLLVGENGVVYDSTYDSHPAIGHGFLTAAAEEAGADPEKAEALVHALAWLVRTDNDVVELVPAAAALA
ncbi:hypothetical protein [Kocuria dechangensis]|nr:hypothetical protein [Kocuria dechangensis]